MLEILILTVCVVLSLAIGSFVYARNPKHTLNRLYAVLTLSIILFSVFNYLSLSTNNRLFYIRAVIFFSCIAISSLYYLIYYLEDDVKKLNIFQEFGIFYTFIVSFLTLTPLVFSGLSTGQDPVPVPEIGALFFALQLIVFSLSIFALLIKRITTRKDLIRKQYIYILFGSLPIIFLAPITGFIMPVVFQNASLINLSPVYALFFVSIVGYAIIRHKLFDIKAVLARTVAYVFTMGLVILVYVGVVIVLSNLLSANTPTLGQQLFLAASIIFGVLVFGPVKKVFDRITNSIFYKDAYVAQDVINKINSILVSTTKLDELLRNTSEVIESDIKVTYANFYLDSKATIEFHLAGSNTKIFGQTQWVEFLEYLNKSEEKIVSINDIQSTNIKNMMRSLDIECAIRMKSSGESVGFLILGGRKSGNNLSISDIQLLEIIADEVAIAVQNSLRYEEIAQFNVTLQKKVDAATSELQKSNEKLQKLDEAKDEFISMASHQLRTPLTSVKGYISMLLEGDAGNINESQKKFLDQAYVSSQRMVYLIADLLNVSRLRTGKFVIEPKPTYLPDVVESEIAQLLETAKVRGLGLKFNKPSSFPTLNLDETKIRQVIMNFVDNAIYYTPKGGKITISLNNSNESVVFTVEDTGIGVPKSEQHHLFTKFYRAANAKNARPDGTGLGLFMAKKVVVAQGGAIIFKTEEGKGSTFGFSFPLEKLEVEK